MCDPNESGQYSLTQMERETMTHTYTHISSIPDSVKKTFGKKFWPRWRPKTEDRRPIRSLLGNIQMIWHFMRLLSIWRRHYWTFVRLYLGAKVLLRIHRTEADCVVHKSKEQKCGTWNANGANWNIHFATFGLQWTKSKFKRLYAWEQ